MEDKFSNRLPGDREGKKLKRCTPGEELAGKGYLEDFDSRSFEEGYSEFDGPRDMDPVRMKIERLMGEW